MKTESDNERMTITDAARELKCSRWSVYRAMATGKLEPVRCGISHRAYYVTRASVKAAQEGGAQ